MASILRKGESALREIVHPKKSKDNLTLSGSSSPGTRSPPPEEVTGRKSSDMSGQSSPGSKRAFFGFGKKKGEKDSRSIGSTSGTMSPPESPPKSLATSPDIKPTTATTLPDAQVPVASISSESHQTPAAKEASAPPPPIIVPSINTAKPLSPPLSQPHSPTSPVRSISPPSPPLNSKPIPPVPGSPSHLSPSRAAASGSAQIFERNVQETHPISTSASPSSTIGAVSRIPAHITTENYIPPVLEASSIAITDSSIDPDNVEVVMHSQHQPIAQLGQHHHSRSIHGDSADSDLSSTNTSPLRTALDVTSSNPADKRRLSFISFSDIVQAEQADLFDSTMLSPSPKEAVVPGAPATTVIDQVGIQGITETLARRSPSPVGRGRGYANSPPRTSAGFIPDMRENEGLVVETMGQALRKTGSGDLGKGVPGSL